MADSCNFTDFVDESSLTFTVNKVIVPIELLVGFVFQSVNLLVLHGHRIKGLAYTLYLKALSINYLVNIIFIIPSILRKNHVVDRSSYMAIWYHAHLEQYFANLFIISGNLIIVTMAADALRAVLFPLHCLIVSRRRRYFALVAVYVVVAVVILPTTSMKGVLTEYSSANDTKTFYCTITHIIPWIMKLRYVLAAIFEVFVIMLISLIYAAVLIKFRLIIKHHEYSVRQLSQTPSRLLSSSHRKATVICLAYVTAFVICNFPSAMMEMIHLISLATKHLNIFLNSEMKANMRDIGNTMLALNFTLSFILQYLFSRQYRKQLHRMLKKGTLAASLVLSYSSPGHRRVHRIVGHTPSVDTCL